jgi:lysophospholipase L1-like esterase
MARSIKAGSLSVITLAFILVVSIAGCDQTPRLSPLAEDAVILAFGDSLTYGTGANRSEAYPAQLQSLVSRTVINAGIPGEISQRGLHRLPVLLQQHKPDLVIICHGGNDILRRLNLQQTRRNIQQMIDLSREYGAEVVLVGVPDFGLLLSSATIYTELAEHNNLPIESSVLPDILRNGSWKSDQIHPNAGGYSMLAERLAQLLKKAAAI